MPKEIIHDQAAMYDVRIGWERDKYVQIGVVTADGRSVIDHLTGQPTDEQREAVRKLTGSERLADLGGRVPHEDGANFTGLWGTLDREGCNHLIRTLRRARDQAFGRDE